MRLSWIALASVAACTPAPRPVHGDDAPPACVDGTIRCSGLVAQTCAGGTFVDSETCPTGCTDGRGCTACSPSTGTCTAGTSHACADDGSGYVDTFCDPLQGMGCDGVTGQCTGACAPRQLGASYIGCDYYATVIGNTVGEMFDFAIAVGNTATSPATVTIEGGALTAPVTFTLQPRAVKVQTLPWQNDLKLCATLQTDGCQQQVLPGGAYAPRGAYRVRATEPVVAYQFSPLQYTTDGTQFSFSNDASLLLPVDAWRTEYYTAAWAAAANYPSELAVTASRDNTQVTITTRAATKPFGGMPAFAANVPQTVTLGAGDVLELASVAGDLTGSRISASYPVEVTSGHFCANVPLAMAACDHLEESMFPVSALGAHYVINAPAVTTIPSGKVEVIRVIATKPGTVLAYDPPQPGAATAIAQPGDFIELSGNAASFAITASAPVLVAQYMEGQQAGGNTGDPAMALAVPVEQYRTSYLFHAPLNYQSNYVDVTAPVGATILLDGVPLALAPIGTTGFALARAEEISDGPGADGNHAITGDQRFGITVYGYGQYTSYWYPGGLDLTVIE